MTVSQEFRLVAACAMWPPSDRRTEAIRTAAARSLTGPASCAWPGATRWSDWFMMG